MMADKITIYDRDNLFDLIENAIQDDITEASDYENYHTAIVEYEGQTYEVGYSTNITWGVNDESGWVLTPVYPYEVTTTRYSYTPR